MPITEKVTLKLKRMLCVKKAVSAIRHRKKLDTNSPNQLNEELQKSLDFISEENRNLKTQIKQTLVEVEKSKQKQSEKENQYEEKEVLFDEDKRFLLNEIKQLKEEVNMKQEKIDELERDNKLLKKEDKTKEILLNEVYKANYVLTNDICRLEQEVGKLKIDLENCHIQTRQNILVEKNTNSVGNNNTMIEELDSLKTVLELKQEEIKVLRFTLGRLRDKENALTAANGREYLLKARCEDLEEQLHRKNEREKSFVEESTQNERFACQIEELRWKLKQKGKKVDPDVIENTDQFGIIPQTSLTFPRVKGVVKKRASIGYILDMDEKPEKLSNIEQPSTWL